MTIPQQLGRARWLFVGGLAMVIALLANGSLHAAGPFTCFAKQPTFRAEMADADLVVVAKLQFALPPDKDSGQQHAQFEIVEVLKGEKKGLIGGQVVVPHFDLGKAGDIFYFTKSGPPHLEWSSSVLLTPRMREYVHKVAELPAEVTPRLQFFLSHLDDKEEYIAHDACEEFDEISYADLATLKPHLNREQVLRWLENPEALASRKRLYYRLLSICGTAGDASLLEAKTKSADRKDRLGLDQLLACYVMLQGDSGLAMVEERYLKNKRADYADTYAAILACRFHLTETNVLPRHRVIASLKLMLARPELADLVIPDLAKLEEWTVADQLFDMYKNADTKTTWVRVPVVQYLRACPLDCAPAMLKECERIDPEAFKRGKIFVPVIAPAKTGS
ncbi:hypothetical protein NA78x_001272 [Anatilimnocola sp. NA78]|uniref:hypothetical protein n=1 Tax=Anatilimnocola sp. NA78 TaxID=3415683 RepID=UPI003CE4A55C